MYVLNLSEDGRVLCAYESAFAVAGSVIVDALPEGNIYEYRYENGEFIHDPLPEPEPSEPEADTDEVLNALLGVE